MTDHHPFHSSGFAWADATRAFAELAAELLFGTAAEAPQAPLAKRYSALVGRADVVTARGRLFPRADWAAAVVSANAACRAGALGGSVDHPGPLAGGGMRSRAVLWHGLELRAGGGVWGEFSIVPTQAGRNLLSLVEAGGAIAFDPVIGRASPRAATAADRLAWGLPEGADVVIVERFDLAGVDVVGVPELADAVLPGRRPQ